MQRLPRYILLLQELRKQTEKFNPGHDDLGNLQMAIKGIKDVTATVSPAKFCVFIFKGSSYGMNHTQGILFLNPERNGSDIERRHLRLILNL